MVGGDPPEQTGRQNHGMKALGLSQQDFMPEQPMVVTHHVAIRVADGFDTETFGAMRTLFKAQGATTWVIAPRHHMIKSVSGTEVMADHNIEGMCSTMFDAIFICPGTRSTITLCETGLAVHWVREAFGHL